MPRWPALPFIVVLAWGCGPGAPKPSFEGNPEWVGRASGVFPGPKGAGKIEGIAAGQSPAKADLAACAETARILRARLAAMLPATDSPASLPPLKLSGERVISRWRGDQGGPAWSLCVLDREAVRASVALSLSGSIRDFMLVQADLILSK